MWSRLSSLLVCGGLLGCTLGESPVPPVVEPMPLVVEEPALPFCPLDRVEVTLLPRGDQVPVLGTQAVPKRGKASTPLALVTQAQTQARVEPSLQGYAGGGEHGYRWMAGTVFTIYLSKAMGTGIFLPPGERLASGLFLDKEVFDVQVEHAGSGETAYDALIIRPLAEKGTVETFLLTESGRRYLLHLVIGQTGMLAVSFAGP